MRKLLISLVLGTLVLVGCAHPQFASVEDAAYSGALCVDRSGYRVPDTYCPIGDDPVAASPYAWRYQRYQANQPDIDVVYVGYQVGPAWSTTRPANVTTINIDRGSYPEKPAAGQPQTSDVRVPTAPARKAAVTNPDIKRGGLGVPVTQGQAAGTQTKGVPVQSKQPVTAPRPNPPAPATRVNAVTPPKTGKK